MWKEFRLKVEEEKEENNGTIIHRSCDWDMRYNKRGEKEGGKK